MHARELVHFTGHYHLHTGRALNPGVAKEIPDFGTVIASELDSQRRDSDTFPTYLSTNLVRTRTGIVGPGFFPARFTGLDLDTSIAYNVFGGKADADADLVRRWERLRRLSEVSSADQKRTRQIGFAPPQLPQGQKLEDHGHREQQYIEHHEF